METGVLQAKTEEIQRTCAVWISKEVCNQWNRVLLLYKQEKICGSRLNAVGRRLSESRVRENLMHGLRWQAMETETTAPSLDPTSHGYLPPSVANHKSVPVMVWAEEVV